MSFERSAGLEAQPTTFRREDDPQYSDDPEFNRFTADLSDNLFSLTSNISQLNRQLPLLGTKRETERVRERVQDLLEETNTKFKDIGDGIKKLSEWPDLGPSQKFTRSKLNREFQISLSEFQVLQNQVITKQKASASAARIALEDSQDASQSAQGGVHMQQQQQQQDQVRLAPQSEVDFQESLIIERESEIRQIEQSVGELNELFRDVATMVHAQGDQLDTIYVTTDGVLSDTRGAEQELRSAARYQRGARNKACCLLLILAIVLVVVILAVVVP